jgi:thioesterase domain-containing protein
VPHVFDGDVIIFSARRDEGNESSDPRNWNPYAAGAITVYPVDCGHDDMMASESLALYGEQLKLALRA